MKKLSEVALFTDQVEALASFYERLLGAPPVHRSADLALFDVAGVQLLIHKRIPAELGEPANEDHLALAVEDLDVACQELKARRLLLELEPRGYDWGRSAYLRDPDGRLIELH